VVSLAAVSGRRPVVCVSVGSSSHSRPVSCTHRRPLPQPCRISPVAASVVPDPVRHQTLLVLRATFAHRNFISPTRAPPNSNDARCQTPAVLSSSARWPCALSSPVVVLLCVVPSPPNSESLLSGVRRQPAPCMCAAGRPNGPSPARQEEKCSSGVRDAPRKHGVASCSLHDPGATGPLALAPPPAVETLLSLIIRRIVLDHGPAEMLSGRPSN
jgi:hypothetical protein